MKVKLYHPLNAPNGQEFDEDHAERIMNLSNNGGWTREAENKKSDVVEPKRNKGKAKEPKA